MKSEFFLMELNFNGDNMKLSKAYTYTKEGLTMTTCRIVLASHGKLAAGMLNTVQMLLGQLDNITAYCLMPEEDVNAFAKKLEEEVKTYGAENILFMTELIHGSPFNSVVALTREYDIHHISGTNLAMLMEVVLARNEDGITLDQLCERAIAVAPQSYVDVRKLLQASEDEEDEDE